MRRQRRRPARPPLSNEMEESRDSDGSSPLAICQDCDLAPFQDSILTPSLEPSSNRLPPMPPRASAKGSEADLLSLPFVGGKRIKRTHEAAAPARRKTWTLRRRRPSLFLLFFAGFLTLIIGNADAAASDIVHLHDGSPLFGNEITAPNGKVVTVFYGIPFAEPPVGKLRFHKPKPKQPWRNILNATVMPNSCIQSLDTYFGNFYGADMWNANTKQSEDCLYLNVFVPGRINPSKRLTVMIWIFGGGFWSGTSTLDVYDGRIFSSEENVIMVSMNYRVSIFGFLYMGRPEAPGNMGLWDQQLVLKWVHANIDVFGGDSSRITLFGESAGAASVNMHMLSEKSTPYFHRAIIQSGAATAPWAMETREVALARIAVVYNAMRCDPTANMSLTEVDVEKISACFMAADAETLRDHEWAPVREFVDFPWVPVVDGDFLVEAASTSLRQGHFKRTQLLAGSNLDESIYFIVYQLGNIFPLDQFFTKTDFITDKQTWLRGLTDLLPRQMIKSSLALSAIIHEYEPAELPIRPHDWVSAMDKVLGDLQFTCSVNEMALAHSRHGGDTFYYYFTHRASQQTWPRWMGVLHGYEINFVFGEPYNRAAFNYTSEEQELSSRFMRYWANFARTGDPNKNDDGSYTSDTWPRYTAATMEYMNLTVESDYAKGASRIGNGPRRKQCAFWKAYLPNLMAAVAAGRVAEEEEEDEGNEGSGQDQAPDRDDDSLPPAPPDAEYDGASFTVPIVLALLIYAVIMLAAICLVAAPGFLRLLGIAVGDNGLRRGGGNGIRGRFSQNDHHPGLAPGDGASSTLYDDNDSQLEYRGAVYLTRV